MADQDCNKTYPPLALSSTTPSWWEFHHQATCPTTSTPTSSWSNAAASSPLIVYDNYNNSKSSPCDHEYPSFTASNHSTFAVDEPFNRFVQPPSSSNDIITEPSDYNTNLWSQFILSVEGKQNMQREFVRDEAGENLLKALSLKKFSHGMFEPLAFSDYLEKYDSSQQKKWDGNDGDQYANNFFRSYPANIRSSDPLVGPQIMVHRTDPHLFNDIISPIDRSDHDQTKQDFASQQKLCSMGTSSRNTGFDSHSHVFDHTRPDYYLREENDHAYPNLGGLFPRESNMHNQHGHGFEPSLLKSLRLLENIKQQKTIIQRREQLPASTSDGKKKRKDDNPQSTSCSLKKLKHESRSSSPSTVSSSAKARDTAHTPKVKIAAEKIAALQKIVSPFGKTDTASVLQEAIGFIKCHQEQVQLLSNHYLKSSVNKLQLNMTQDVWRGMDRKLLDLKSRGLCLVPTASIPQVYIESAGRDYWPSYRGCLYR